MPDFLDAGVILVVLIGGWYAYRGLAFVLRRWVEL